MHALAIIYLVRYIHSMQTAFEALVEPNRRRILDLLREEERTVGELVAHLSLSQPAVSKHLRVLRDAGLVTARVDAQRRRYRVRPAPLAEVDAWLAPYRRFWDDKLEALERYLANEDGGRKTEDG
jgi:DNA-binding transcriptional ArsR family regulator